MKILFIAGNAHSGTTIFEQLLVRELNVLGLGEIYYSYQAFVRKEIPKYTCSCNNQSDCIWKLIIENWTINNVNSYEEAYQILIQTVKTVFPEIKVISDSSKYPKAFTFIKIHEPDLILVTKNPRSWMNSALRRRLHKKGEDKNWFQKIIIRFRFLQSWSRLNTFFLSYPNVNVVLYESIAFEAEATLKHLTAQIKDLEFRSEATNQFIHQLIGNEIRHKSYKIEYDTRWIWTKDTKLDLIILLPTVQKTWSRIIDRVANYQKSIYDKK